MKRYVHLIRHGITQGLVEEWFYGWLDIPITPDGYQALLYLKNRGIYPDIKGARLVTSGMLRANQTMEAIFDVKSSDYERQPDLKELNFGDWEGKYFKDMDSMEEWYAWSHDLTGEYSFPNGDSAKSFSERVFKGFDEIFKDKDEKTIIVCHGGVIAALMARFFPNETGDDFFQWSPEPGRGYTIMFNDDEPIGFDRIEERVKG